MRTISKELRKVDSIEYTLERKRIKNINLRIHHDGSVYASAPSSVPIDVIERFILSRKDYILKVRDSFLQNHKEKPEMQYISGEEIAFLGKNLRIKIEKDNSEYVESDCEYVSIHVKHTDCYDSKKKLFESWINEQCRLIFIEIMQEVHKDFIRYNVKFPELKIRNMTSRWGSCRPYKGVITLNKKLIEAPKCCIKYVVYHEFCHFIHPDHSKNFYSLLQSMMSEWRENRILLEKSVSIVKK